MAQSTGWYDTHAPDLVRRYGGVNPAALHNWLKGLLPDAPGTVLDIGAGSGRDAAWFSAQGYDVIAVEPSSGMRCEGQRVHPELRPLDRRPASRSDHSRPDGDQFRSRDADRCLETHSAISARPGLPQDRSAGQVR